MTVRGRLRGVSCLSHIEAPVSEERKDKNRTSEVKSGWSKLHLPAFTTKFAPEEQAVASSAFVLTGVGGKGAI